MQSKQSTAILAIGVALAALSSNIAASGFALIEQNASGMGNAYAGSAALAEDASTIFFNPAGMSRLNGKQLVMVGHLIKPSIKFTGTGLTIPDSSNMGGDAGSVAFVPNAYFAMEMNPSIWFGLGINAPFGLQTEYDTLWVGRRHANKSMIETINLNPSVAYRVNDAISLGAGINYQHISGKLTSDAVTAGGISTVNGSDSAWGYNLGVLYNITQQTRLGFAYRSAINYTLNGDVTFSNPSSPTYQNGPVTWAIEVPDSFSSSVLHKIRDQWDLLADLTWTGWSKFQRLEVTRETGSTISSTQENWQDTWRVAIGANHHYSERWTSRVGLAYDQSPVSDQFRTARIPDSDRTWFSLGGQHKPFRDSAIDLGYAHIWLKNSTINATNPAPTLAGSYKSTIDILSVQYTQSF